MDAIIISALYEGWATPTESGAPGAFGMSGAQCSVWFGIIVVKMAEVCLITPPIGLNCFVVNGVRPDIPLSDVFRGIALFFVADVVTISRLAPVGQQLILCHVAERALGQPKSC